MDTPDGGGSLGVLTGAEQGHTLHIGNKTFVS